MATGLPAVKVEVSGDQNDEEMGFHSDETLLEVREDYFLVEEVELLIAQGSEVLL